MAVTIAITADTPAEIEPYMEALRLTRDTAPCPQCNGTGSDPAWPGRGFRCMWCNAKGRVAKPSVVGTQAPCVECRGFGVVYEWGNGMNDKATSCRPCPSCSAKAEAPCVECNGTGRMVDINSVTHHCPACGPKDQGYCGTCRGTGRVRTLNGDSDPCPDCA